MHNKGAHLPQMLSNGSHCFVGQASWWPVWPINKWYLAREKLEDIP
jgi:hypothetical protein|tara:strand:- start:8483 stop:8620 length:138 start_codon:yes stop_codon:yes gene_type:complete